MQTLEIQEAAVETNHYLGFQLLPCGPWFEAIPSGNWGATLLAEDLPRLRKKIWIWWYLVK